MFFMHALSESGEPNTELLWLLWTLTGFLALTIIVGWRAGSRKPDPTRAEVEPPPSDNAHTEGQMQSMKAKRSSRVGRRKK